MASDAFVYCTCLRDELITYPFNFDLRIDDAGQVVPDLPEAHENYQQTRQLLRNWMHNACGHKDMVLAQAHFGEGFQRFYRGMAQIGWAYFPILHRHLPETGPGMLPGTAASAALAELAYFQEHAGNVTHTFMVNATNGTVMNEYNPASDGVFLYADGHRYGFDPDGFFIARDDAILFRSRYFRQEILERDQRERPTWVRYTALDSAADYITEAAMSGEMIYWPNGELTTPDGQFRFAYPSEIRVEERPLSAGAFVAVIDGLQRLLRAAMETGNPVVWR